MLCKCFLFILTILILIVAILIALLSNTPVTFHEKTLYDISKQAKIPSEKFNVLNDKGQLNHIGYGFDNLNISFNPEKINPTSSLPLAKDHLQSYRYKKWEAFVFSNSEYVFSFASFDLNYMSGNMFHLASLKDDNTKPIVFQHITPSKNAEIKDNCTENCKNVIYDILPSLNIAAKEYNCEKMKKGVMFLKYAIDTSLAVKEENDFNIKINMDVKLKNTGDSIVTLSPISEDKSLFYYNIKTNILTLKGDMSINNKKVNEQEFLGTYDSGRGAWPIKSGWIWVTGNGYLKESNKKFGLNMGHGFTHSSANMSEDMFILDGKATKLSSIKTIKDTKVNKHGNFDFLFEPMNNDLKNTCRLRFTTIKHGGKEMDIIVAKTAFLTNYGSYSGSCYDGEGVEIKVENVYGLIEDKLSVW